MTPIESLEGQVLDDSLTSIVIKDSMKVIANYV